MSAGIAWALTSAFALGFLFGAVLAATLIVAVRLKIDTTDRREGWRRILPATTLSDSGPFARAGAASASGRKASTKAS